MGDISYPTWIFAGAGALAFLGLRYITSEERIIDAIPTLGGPSVPLLSYIGSIRFLLSAPKLVQAGYDKFKGAPFKIAGIGQWNIIVGDPKLVEDVRKAPDNVLSFAEAINESLAITYTLGSNVHHDGYHIPIVRSQLTRSLAKLFPDVRDEVAAAFTDVIPPTDEWTKLPGLSTIMQVVCRISNRVFVGLPLCRNKDYGQLNIQFTIDVVKGAAIINLFPSFLKPLAGRLFTNVPASIERGMKHLQPLIEERLKCMEEYGEDWSDKPNDMLMWFMEDAKGEERTIRNWTLRILTVNFAAIHTSSMSFTHALFHLAANPQYIQPMREEVEAIVKEEGWTKAAMQKMRKLDSFLKESQRFNGIGCVSMTRKVLQPFTFSDGTRVPVGHYVSTAAAPMHHDEGNYSDPDVFDGFRFANMREEEGEGTKHQFVSTGVDYVPFGHGRHACPGRFFASNELKAMLAHVVITYDLKLENEGVRPADFYFATACSPNPTAEVMFRKRRS
ncbi:hypothetical protein JAAARDRAFT_34744 [Jaapia argillacea MUCL 33604]|uniref:Cytochrome P450 n=1 Tax=Jaapia argillacea MUCL 33604 TaxID=933084 RepID=A0A067PSZ6_9AGAM|nr:hypothetical protein JAAARDRAFT_34744 [Jaapia argillacea MUCL 33604]